MLRMTRLPLWLGLIIIILSVFLSIPPLSYANQIIEVLSSSDEDVTIHFLDVGQGDAILIKTSTKNVLIDGGPTVAGNTLINYLNTYQASKIDLLIATHSHEDHIGGLITVLQSSIPIQDIIYNGYNHTSQTFNTWKTLALTSNLTQASRNQVYAMSPTINFTVISPTNPTQFGSTANDINDNSLVLRLQISNTSILFTGDSTSDTEANILSAGLALQSQVLKIAHHGSSTSTSQALLNEVRPAYAIISAGINNSYGHPTQQTLDRLTNNNIITYGTYKDGTITLSITSAALAPSPKPTSPTPTSTNMPTNPPTSVPTPVTPNPTANQTPNVRPTQTPNPTPTPSITEFMSPIAIMIGLMGISILLVKYQRNRATKNGD